MPSHWKSGRTSLVWEAPANAPPYEDLSSLWSQFWRVSLLISMCTSGEKEIVMR